MVAEDFSFLITNLFPNTVVESMPKKLGSLKRMKRDKTLKVHFQTFNKHGKNRVYIDYIHTQIQVTLICLFVTKHINDFFYP